MIEVWSSITKLLRISSVQPMWKQLLITLKVKQVFRVKEAVQQDFASYLKRKLASYEGILYKTQPDTQTIAYQQYLESGLLYTSRSCISSTSSFLFPHLSLRQFSIRRWMVPWQIAQVSILYVARWPPLYLVKSQNLLPPFRRKGDVIYFTTFSLPSAYELGHNMKVFFKDKYLTNRKINITLNHPNN